jgi:hypothetical protein
METNNRPFNLLDGASCETLQVLREVGEMKKGSVNQQLSLELQILKHRLGRSAADGNH